MAKVKSVAKICSHFTLPIAVLMPAVVAAMNINETTTCKLVASEKITASGPCEMVGFAGQGVYEVNVDAFGISITLDANSDATMDGRPLAKYMRDANFGRTKDRQKRKYMFYVSGKGDLCVMAIR